MNAPIGSRPAGAGVGGQVLGSEISAAGFRRGTGVAGLVLVVLWLSQFPVYAMGSPPLVQDRAAFAHDLSAIKMIAFIRIVLDLGACAAVMVFIAWLLHLICWARPGCEPSGNRRATEGGDRRGMPVLSAQPMPGEVSHDGAQKNDGRRCDGRQWGRGRGPSPCRSPPRWYRRLAFLAVPSCALVLAQ
jgi:hypothetical protein